MTSTIIEEAQTDSSFWIDLIERMGLPLALIFFGCLLVWRLHPHVIEWFKESTNSMKVLSLAVPQMQDSLRKVADAAEGSQQNLEHMGGKLAHIESQNEQILTLLKSSS